MHTLELRAPRGWILFLNVLNGLELLPANVLLPRAPPYKCTRAVPRIPPSEDRRSLNDSRRQGMSALGFHLSKRLQIAFVKPGGCCLLHCLTASTSPTKCYASLSKGEQTSASSSFEGEASTTQQSLAKVSGTVKCSHHDLFMSSMPALRASVAGLSRLTGCFRLNLQRPGRERMGKARRA